MSQGLRNTVRRTSVVGLLGDNGLPDANGEVVTIGGVGKFVMEEWYCDGGIFIIENGNIWWVEGAIDCNGCIIVMYRYDLN